MAQAAFGLELSKDGKTLYVCDRFLNRINVVNVATGQVVHHLSVSREPLHCALEPDGKTLWVSNQLPVGPASDPANAAVVDLYDVQSRKHLGELKLPAGGTDVQQIACSPDGRWAYVVHVLGRFFVRPHHDWSAIRVRTGVPVFKAEPPHHVRLWKISQVRVNALHQRTSRTDQPFLANFR